MVWLLPVGQGGFTVHRACLEDGHMAFLHLNSSRPAAFREKGFG